METSIECSLGVAIIEATVYGIAFNSDKTEMYLIGLTTKKIHQYTLSIAGDMSSASYTGSVSIAGECNIPKSIMFNSDGTKMYIYNFSFYTYGLYQYTLSSAWNVSTATYDSIRYAGFRFRGTSWYDDIYFKSDGTKIYAIYSDGYGCYIRQYSLSPVWDISTIAYDDEKLFIGGMGHKATGYRGFCFGNNGKYIYAIGTKILWTEMRNTFTIYQFTLGTEWDLSTEIYVYRKSYLLDDITLYGTNIEINADGLKVYLSTTIGKIYEFDLSTAWAINTASYNNIYYAINESGDSEEESESADIGSEAIDRPTSNEGYTNINKGNPCNVNGRITSIEIWANTNLVGCKVASFVLKSLDGDDAYLTVRDYVTIGAVTAGSKQTFAINLIIRKGDYLGCYSESGAIEYTSGGGNGIWYLSGDKIPCENILFAYIGDEISLYGTGIKVTPKTFAEIDGTLLINQETDIFFGKTIDCELNTIRDISGACLGDVVPTIITTDTDIAFVDGDGGEDTITQVSAGFVTAGFVIGDTITISGSVSNDGTYTILSISAGVINVATGSLIAEGVGALTTITAGYPGGGVRQNIRVTVTIDGEDVTDSLIGGITIAHNKNYISTFSFQLGDSKYSPLVDSHIAVDSEVVITVFINGQEMKLFTGLIDNTNTDYDGGYKLMIKGRGYGKKLLEKTMTLISIEQSAKKKYRGSLVEFIAGKGNITNVDVPIGDAIGIDHSFQDQSLWDMIQKECAIEGWFVRFDENAKMILKTSSKKTTADWEYGEDKFEELGLETTDREIINKVTILGAIWEEEIITVETKDIEGEPITSSIDVPEEEYSESSITQSKDFARLEKADDWSYSDGIITIKSSYIGAETISEAFIQQLTIATKYKYSITLAAGYTLMDVKWTVTGGAMIYWEGRASCNVKRDVGFMYGEFAFEISVTVKYKEQTGGGSVWITENLPAEEEAETITTIIIYHQVKATVSDSNSIALYGERKPNNEGTLQFPLAETEEQCKRIGENVIIESHRFIKQPDYLVAFNPKLVVGCTVKLTDTKIGYDEEWVVEEVIYMLNIGKTGEIKARTRIGCVYYA